MNCFLFYCRLCLKREQERYNKNNSGHVSRVKNYGNSSTCTLKEHLRTQHSLNFNTAELKDNDNDCDEEDSITEGNTREANNTSCRSSNAVKVTMKQSTLSFTRKLSNFEPYSTQFELNRDFAIWASLDLQPFGFTEDKGMKYFFEKNFPYLHPPSRSTISRSALLDTYDAVANEVKKELHSVEGTAVCLMFDGWTDRYKKHPYLGLRMAYVNKDWNYKVITISCKVLEKHTAECISSHVKEEMKLMGIDLQQFLLFSAHDGAANMVKTSSLLRTCHYQHCVAHSLHLLLMTDGVNIVPEITELVERCKNAVNRLGFKSYLVEDERTKMNDRESMYALAEKLEILSELLQADSNISIGLEVDESNVDRPTGNAENAESGTNNISVSARVIQHEHQTLKQCCVTRWNSLLTMIDSVLCLWTELMEALKRNGDRQYCLSDDDKAVLTELRAFLLPFKDLSDLVSSEQPHLGLVPLIIREIKDVIGHVDGECDAIGHLKDAINAKLNHRFKVTDNMQIATILDPTLKHMVMQVGKFETSDSTKVLLREETLKAVQRRNKYCKNAARNSSQQPQGVEASSAVNESQCQNTSANSKKLRLLQKFGVCVAADNLANVIDAEISSYLSCTVTGDAACAIESATASTVSPLKFWKTREHIYPNLSVLARNYFTASASSVPVEEMFSTTGLILNLKRSSMAPYRANILSFVHNNYPKFFPISCLLSESESLKAKSQNK